MKILGVDADSKKIAIVCLEKSGIIKYHVLLTGISQDPGQRLLDLILMFESQMKAMNPQVVYISEK